MITFSSEAQAKLTQTHIIELLQKAKLCKTANKFVGSRNAMLCISLLYNFTDIV